MRQNSKILVLTVLLAIWAFSLGVSCSTQQVNDRHTSDNWVRNRVVLLEGLDGLCTGFQVVSPKGKIFTLTAKHCLGLAFNGTMIAVNEAGRPYSIKVIDVSKTADIMILSGDSDAPSLLIAATLSQHSPVHTVTHNDGKPAFRSDGEVVCWTPVVTDKQDRRSGCSEFRTLPPESGTLTVTNLFVLPGASGGPLLDDHNEVVGVVSRIDGMGFSYHVSLRDIHLMLQGR